MNAAPLYSNQLLSRVLTDSLYFLRPLLRRALDEEEEAHDPQLCSDISTLSNLITSINFFREQLPAPSIDRSKRLAPSISSIPSSYVLCSEESDITSMRSDGGEKALSLVLNHMSDRNDCQAELLSLALINQSWNEKANAVLWRSPVLQTKKSLFMLAYCSSLCLVKSPLTWSLYVSRLDFTKMMIADPSDACLINQVVKCFPHANTLKWGSNPLSETTLYLFFKHCVELKNLSVGGTIISGHNSVPDDYLLIFQQGISRLEILELLDYEDQTSFVESPGGSSPRRGVLPTPTTLDDILKTIPVNNAASFQEYKHVSLSTSDLSHSTLNDATSPASKGFGKFLPLWANGLPGLAKKEEPITIELKNLPVNQRMTTRNTELPLLLRKHLTGKSYTSVNT